MEKDEIIFTGQYKDFKLGIRFDLSGKSEKDVAAALAYVSEKVEPHAFRFSGIDTDAVDGFAKISGKGLAAVYDFLEANKPGDIKDALGKALKDPKLMPAAESYLMNRLLAKAGIAFKAGSNDAKPVDEGVDDFIGFIGKYGKWIAIKKLGLENVKDYEVSGILSGVNHTAVNKGFDFAGVEKDDATVASVTKGMRKSFNNAAAMLKALEPKLDGGKAYLVCKSLETLGYPPYATPGMLTDAYPDIKPPKTRGRKPKG
ncbi:MAG: DUF2666 family protein [Candidatus Micrarchaeota archaeon]